MSITNIKKIVLAFTLIFVCVLAVGIFHSPKTSADSGYADSNGNGIPDWVESALINACSGGAHTYHLIWFDPAVINPSPGETVHSTSLKSVAYICPGVSYTFSDNITHYITGWDPHLSFPGGTTFYMGTAFRGGFSSVASLPVNISLSGLPYNQWDNFNIDYWGEAYPGGSYDCFQWDGKSCAPVTTTVSVYITAPPGPATITRVTPYCSGSTPMASLSWSGTPNWFGFIVDISSNNFFTWSNRGIASSPMTDIPNGFSPALTLTPGTTYQLRVYNGLESGPVSFTAPACNPPAPSCTLVSTTPVDPEPGQPFKAQITFANGSSGGTMTTASNSLRVTIADAVPAYSNVTLSYSPSSVGPGGSATSAQTSIISIPTTGFHTVTITFGGVAGSFTCRSSNGPGIGIFNKPYLRVYDGDVLAGASEFGGSCGGTPSGNIETFNKENAGYDNGAGTQLAAQATGTITDFATAALRGGAPTGGPPSSLAFANSGVSAWGGSFGGAPCTSDYYTLYAPAAASFNTGSGMNVNGLGSGKSGYKPSTGTLTVNAGGAYNIGLGVRAKVFVDGNTYIHNNIGYTGSGGWGSLSDIPSLYLVVKGDIYIDKDVTNLDGVFIAQPNGGSGGNIYTCVDNNQKPYSTANGNLTNMNSDCTKQLTINGAFIASKVYFHRTNGTLNNSANNEDYSSSNIAEIFKFSPELWLVNPGLNGGDFQYDSITSLPPVL